LTRLIDPLKSNDMVMVVNPRASLFFLHEADEVLLAAAPRLLMPLPLTTIEKEPG